MKKSDLIKALQGEVKKSGDMYLQYYSYSDEDVAVKSAMLSPTRKKKNGERAAMNIKEFTEYVKKKKGKV